jgi:hypothetical protein
MHKVLFLLHGIGKHDEHWSDQVRDRLINTATELPDDLTSGFSRQKLVDALSDVHFVELRYDELYQQKVADWIKQGGDVLQLMPAGAMERVEGILGSKQSAEDFAKNNLTDLLLYHAMPEFRQFTRKHIGLQIEKAIAQYGMASDQARYYLLAHSMGTAVAHDTLAQLSTTAGSPLQGGLIKLDALFQLANTSALLKTDYDPRTSAVRLYADPNHPNCISAYVDAAHAYDPVAQVGSFRSAMDGTENFSRYDFVSVKKILALNIHDIDHYLQFPAVYMIIYRLLFGDLVIPFAYYMQKSAEEPVSEAEAQVVQTVKALSEGHLGEAADHLKELIGLIAEFAKHGVTV